MKKFALILCALFVAQLAFGALDRDNFDYRNMPEYQAIPTTPYKKPTVQPVQQDLTAQAEPVEEEVVTKKGKKVTKKSKRRIRFRNEGSSWINTYWNFGQPVYGETGRF